MKSVLYSKIYDRYLIAYRNHMKCLFLFSSSSSPPFSSSLSSSPTLSSYLPNTHLQPRVPIHGPEREVCSSAVGLCPCLPTPPCTHCSNLYLQPSHWPLFLTIPPKAGCCYSSVVGLSLGFSAWRRSSSNLAETVSCLGQKITPEIENPRTSRD